MSIKTIVVKTKTIYEMSEEEDRLAMQGIQQLISKMPADSLISLKDYLNHIIDLEIARKKQC
jgi:hypothetical protein